MRILSESLSTTDVVDTGRPIWNEVANQFNSRNNRISDPIAIPVIVDVKHTINTDGTANVDFEWEFNGEGDNYNIDGFFVYIRAFLEPTYYVFGSGAGREQVYNVNRDRTVFTAYGVPADSHYYFGIEAYRTVDTDINSNGIIKSSIAQSPSYQPVEEVVSGTSIGWNNVTGKPITYPPSSHGNESHNKNFAITYGETIGDGLETEFEIEHALNSDDIIIAIWNLGGADPILEMGAPTSIEIINTNKIKIVFGTAPAENEFRVVIK
jgi:hypothetical protein